MAERLRITAYSDYVCPWCYIGWRRIEALRREFPVDVEWRPFELQPGTPKPGLGVRLAFGDSSRAAAVGRNIEQLAGSSGIAMRMPRLIANSHLALEAAEFVREHGPFEPFHAALFEANFGDGRDIGDAAVLCEIAAAGGIDPVRLREALDDRRYAGAIDRATAVAREDGIVSTPTFVYEGGFRLIGAQDYDVFASITRRILQRRSEAAGPMA
jgi:predicted DsbA family dithiol-disulfide isomerase